MLTAVLLLFASALAAPAVCRRAGSGAAWLLATVPLTLTALFAFRVGGVAEGEAIREVLPWVEGLGVSLAFSLDGLSLLFALLVTGIGTLVVIYAGAYLSTAGDRGRFLGALLAFMASMLGLVLADDLLVLFLFWELTSVTSYLLIGFKHETAEARAAALQALLVTALGGLALLAAFLLLGQAAGTLRISELGEVAGHPLYGAILALVLAGAFTKSAQVPFHFWLPGAMAAPSPASAYLHSSTMVKAGVYLLARLHPSLGGTDAWLWSLVAVGGATMLVGAARAVRQSDLKLVLAHSTVSVLGMLVMLVGLGSPAALKAAAALILAHALYKGALFLVAGAVDHQAGTREIPDLGGLVRSMPVTAVAAGIAALSMAGLPPLLGFVAKEASVAASLAAPGTAAPWLTAAVAAAAALGVVAAFLAGVRPFLGTGGHAGVREAPAAEWLGPLLMGAAGVGAGLAPGVVGRLLVGPAAGAAAGIPVAAKLVLWPGLGPVLTVSVAALAAGGALATFHRPLATFGARIGTLTRGGTDALYRRSLDGLFALARGTSRLLQEAPLSRHLRIVVASVTALVGASLLARVELPEKLEVGPVRLPELGLAAAVVVAAGLVVIARSRLAAVAALGVVGFAVALLFLYYSAPDLAMTQFVVETLTVVLVVLAFRRLPRFRRISSRATRWRDALLATAAGALMSGLVILATRVQLAGRISEYFAEESVPRGFGRNVVNVILVDFRALDTLGEITVLVVACLGAYALLRLALPATRDEGTGGEP